MNGPEPPRPRCDVATVLALVALVAPVAPLVGPARTAEIPVGAHGSSLLVAEPLLGSANLLFVHPHRAFDHGDEIYVAATSGYGTTARSIAAIAAGDRWRAFGLSQTLPSPVYVRSTTFPLIHLGATMRLGGLRAGVAVRGGYGRTLDEIRSSPDASYPTFDREESELRRWAGAIGLGVGGGPRFLDLSVEAFTEKTTSDDLRERVGSDSSRTRFTLSSDPRVRASLRAGWPLGDAVAVRAAADFAVLTTATEFRASGSATAVEIDGSPYAHDWSAGVLVEAERPAAGRILVHARYRDLRPPREFSAVLSTYEPLWRLREVRERTETVDFGMALIRDIGWDIEGLAGILARFRVGHHTDLENEWRGGVPDDLRIYHQVQEDFEQAFAWGARRAFGSITLAGALRGDLPLGDLFTTLDVTLRL